MGRGAATTPTSEFFGELSRRGHEPLLEKASGVIRFDIDDDGRTERWVVTIDHGDIEVSRRNVAAVCRFRAPRPLFDRIVRGEVNSRAAILRGAVRAEGDWRTLVLLHRLFRRRAEAEG